MLTWSIFEKCANSKTPVATLVVNLFKLLDNTDLDQ